MLEKVAAIIREQLNQEDVEITEATRFKEDLEVDSLDLFELVMAFEEEYGVSIPSEELACLDKEQIALFNIHNIQLVKQCVVLN